MMWGQGEKRTEGRKEPTGQARHGRLNFYLAKR